MSGQIRDRRKRTSRKFTRHEVERLEGRALLASIAEFGLTTGASPTYITAGPNGNLWFTESGTDKIGEITTSGTVSEFALTAGSNPQGIATGPDGNLWFAEKGTDKIGEITTGGTITEFALAAGSSPQEITTGSNDNLWFTESGTNKIGEIVPSGEFAGTITEFALAAGSHPYGITAGPNGNLWFTENGANKVGQIVPSGEFAGTVNTYSLSNGAGPEGITTGSDGNLWFAENGGSNIGQVTLGGQVTEYSIPGENGSPQEIVTGPLGDLYFTESTGNNIVQMTTEGQFTDFAIPTAGPDPVGIAQGPDNHIWFAENAVAQVGRLNLNPTAVNDTYTASESTAANPTSLNVTAANGVLTNDTDPEDDSLSVLFAWTGNRGTAHGTVALNSNGSFTYTPDNGFIGTDSFVYQATDSDDSSNTVTVTIHVDAPPVAVDDNYTALVSTTLTVSNPALGVLVNDTDPNIGHTLAATAATQPSHGTVTLNANGTFTYIPTIGYHGTDSFTYFDTDSDGVSVSNTATVNILVDTPPVAVADGYTTDAGTGLPVTNPLNGVLANDTDADGDPLTAIAVTQPANGTLFLFASGLNANGTFTYYPNIGFTGTDSFTYKVNDGHADGNTVTVTIVVNPLPVAAADSYSVLKDGTLAVTSSNGLQQNDSGTGSLTSSVVTQPTNGTVSLNADGTFTYTPNAGYSGTDSFTYKNNDGIADSNTATVTIKVNNAPVAVAVSYNAIENLTLTKDAAAGVLANATDADGDPLTAIDVIQPTHGTLTLNTDGSFSYVPDANFFGPDSFTYKANDGFADSNTVTVSIRVDAPPQVIDKNYTDVQDTDSNVLAAHGLLVGATDADGDPLTAFAASAPSHGTVTVNADGSFTYIPTAGYHGPDSFYFAANDGYSDGPTALVNIYVDRPPVAVADGYTTVENTTLSKTSAFGVLANDTDTDEQPLTAVVVATTTHGTLDLLPDGSFGYIPTTGFHGTDSFTYQANDGITDSPVTTVTIRVDAPPVAIDQSYTAIEDATLSKDAAGGVLVGATDPDEDPLTANLVEQASHGTVSLNPDGSFTYVPDAGFYGTDSFTYAANDGITDGNTATVTFNVDAPPVAINDAYGAQEGIPLTVNASSGVLTNDTQAQDKSLTAILVSGPSHGSLTLNPDGSLTYIPGTRFFGTDSFTYQAYDGITDSPTPATVTIDVIEDVAPVATNETQVVGEGGFTATPPGVLAIDTDSNGQPLSALLVSGPAHGSLTFNPDGSYTYAPNSGFGTAGSDSFTYRAFDGVLTSNVATVTLTFDGTYDEPVAQDQAYSVAEGSTLATSAQDGLLAGSDDYWSLPLTAIVTDQPAHGTLTSNADGSFTYVPAAGYYGADSFAYEANNGHASSTQATVNLTVTRVDRPPVAVNDSYSTTVGQPPLVVTASVGLLANDSDPQGFPLTAVLTASPAHGHLAFQADGSFTYLPDAGFTGIDTFSYQDYDGQALGNVATVGVTVHPAPPPPPATPGDYDGDGKADVAVYIPALGAYEIKFSSTGAEQIIQFGTPGAGNSIPAPGDYDHSGKTELAVYIPAYGDLIYRPAGGEADVVVPFGSAGPGRSIPAPGDYYGTGQTDVAVYLTASGTYAIQDPTGHTSGQLLQFGMPGAGRSIPAPGDYYGTGQSDIAVYMPSIGAFAIQDPTGKTPGEVVAFGMPGMGKSIPMPGDYDGSGKTELAVYVPSLGEFFYRPADGGPDVGIQFGTPGAGQTLPSPGDYTGVGHDELAAYLPASGTFAIQVPGDTAGPELSIGLPGLGQTFPVTVVNQAIVEMATTVSSLSISIPDLEFPAIKKKNG